MADLINNVTASGLVSGQPTSLEDSLTTQTVDGLSLTKSADKISWADGVLTYTLTIENTGTIAYNGVTFLDTIDTDLVDFVDGSVKINGVAAIAGDYDYNDTTGVLSIHPVTPLDVAAGGGTAEVTFQVQKVTP